MQARRNRIDHNLKLQARKKKKKTPKNLIKEFLKASMFPIISYYDYSSALTSEKQMFNSIQHKCNFPVTTLVGCAANI